MPSFASRCRLWHAASGSTISASAEAYGATRVAERHRHRYEVANDYRDRLEAAGLVISGTSPDGRLVEFAELARHEHPFFVGTQAHPEFRSRPTRAHPLFEAFIAWHLGKVARRNPHEVTAIGWALVVQQIAGLVLSCMYFAIAPALFSLVLIVCLAAATWLATSRSAINQHR